MLAALWNLFRVSENYKILFFLHNITSAAGSTFTSQFHTLPSFPQEYMFHFERAFTSGAVATPRFVTLRLLTGFLSAIWYRIGDNTAQFAMWYPHAHHMIVLFSTAIAILVDNHPEPNEEELIDALSGLGAQFILQFGSTIELDHSQYAPQIRREADVVTLECHDVFVIAWAYVRGFAQSDRCQAPGCVETFSKQNRRFNRCSGCGIMPYCSKSCQAAAWRHPRVPHKTLCQELKSYTRKLAGVSWTQCPQPCAQEVRNRCAKGGVTYFEALVLGLRAVSLYDAACDGALKDLPNGMKDVFEGDVIDFLLGKGLN